MPICQMCLLSYELRMSNVSNMTSDHELEKFQTCRIRRYINLRYCILRMSSDKFQGSYGTLTSAIYNPTNPNARVSIHLHSNKVPLFMYTSLVASRHSVDLRSWPGSHGHTVTRSRSRYIYSSNALLAGPLPSLPRLLGCRDRDRDRGRDRDRDRDRGTRDHVLYPVFRHTVS
jgi:hypothetical protein